MSRLSIGVREFAVPLRREGGLASGAGPGLPSLDLGQEIHLQIQERLRATDAGYKAEHPLQHVFREGSLQLHIRGRCDGLFRHETPLLEEIKSTWRLDALQKALAASPEHPYLLQIQVYAYLHWLKTGETPGLRLRLICLQSLREELLSVPFDPERMQSWVQERCAQIAAEYKRLQGIQKKRRTLAGKIFFPFAAPRPSQVELLESVRGALEHGRHLLLQAPTGLGKTAGVLVPALTHALGQGAPVVYIAPKNSQFQAAIDLVSRLHQKRLGLKVLVLTAKAKACPQAGLNCHEDFCPMAKEYHNKVEAHALAPRDKRKHLWDHRYFQNLGRSFEVCPYEVSMERIREADLIICDYNYIFSPHAGFLSRYADPILPLPDPVLIIDEAHNLHERVREAWTVNIRLSTLQNPSLPSALVDKARALFQALRPVQDEARIDIDDKALKDLLAESLKGMMDRWGETSPPSTDDPLFEFHMALTALEQMLEQSREAVPIIYKRENGDSMIKALCLDPSGFIRPQLERFGGVVAFSATLKPFEFHRDISGFDADRTQCVELNSPFPREHKKILIIPQVHTNLKERERHYQRIALIIQKVSSIKPGPGLVFFPSYGFLQRVQAELQALEPDWSIFTQGGAMGAEAIRQLWRQLDRREGMLLIFAVQGGSLAEGIDFKGRGVHNVFIVGPAVPTANFERRLMQDYLEKTYGRGRSYTYTYPAMTRSIQAAGRIIRDADERGVIVLMDPRFLEADYQETMPTDWFQNNARELLSTRIIEDVTAFWKTEDSDL